MPKEERNPPAGQLLALLEADGPAHPQFTSTGLSRYRSGKVLARFSTLGMSFTMMYMLYGWRTRSVSYTHLTLPTKA